MARGEVFALEQVVEQVELDLLAVGGVASGDACLDPHALCI